jgi:hypothetical protein
VEDDNFDLAIIARGAVSGNQIIDHTNFYRIQIKRYRRRNPGTDDFIAFIKDKIISHYAPDKSLNCVILIETGFKIEKSKLRALINASQFNLANLWLFGYYLNQKLCPYLMPIFPQFTGEIWVPEKAL